MFVQILALLGILLFVWMIVRTLKEKPELFTPAVLNQSFFVMGVLGLMLIAFIGLIVMLLKY